MAKYTVKEVDGFQTGDGSQIRVFTVTEADDYLYIGATKDSEVWLGVDRPTRCARCQTALRGMSSSCPHANAVKRYVAQEAPRDE